MQAAFEAAGPDEIPFVSKTKVKNWVNCAQRFYHDTVADHDGEGSDDGDAEAIQRGTLIHETIEGYYHNVVEYVEETGELPEQPAAHLPDNQDEWEEVLDPYLTNFLAFEARRLERVDTPAEWLPVGIEEEAWLDRPSYPDEPPWMGFADALLPTASLPVSVSSGVALIDFKTGDVPWVDFRDTGIFLELEYYSMLFEDEYTITALGGYYPREDELLTSAPMGERRDLIRSSVREMATASPTDPSDYPVNEQPLCCWGPGDGSRCPYYEDCDSTWAVPVERKSEFMRLCRELDSVAEIADRLGTTVDAVEYWAGKMHP